MRQVQIASFVLSIFAASAAIASVVVQYLAWRSRRTQIRVRVNPGTAEVPGANIDAYGQRESTEGEVVFFKITNRSAHEVKIAGIGGHIASEPERAWIVARPYPLHQTLPITIPPRDNVMLWANRATMTKDRDLSQPTVFSCWTTADDKFDTKPLVLGEQHGLEIVTMQESG